MTDHVPAAAIAAIDWDKITREIHCPLCGYNLRGLTEPRCPECGAAYEWKDFFDPRWLENLTLFEFHRGSIWEALWSTLRVTGSFVFWRDVHPLLPVKKSRLLLYCLLTQGLHFIILSLTLFFEGIPILTSSTVVTPYYSSPYIAWFRICLSATPALIPLIWPLISLLCLFIFRPTLRLAKVRSEHILRAFAYSYDAAAWVLPLSFLNLILVYSVAEPCLSLLPGLIAGLIMFFATAGRWARALGSYLRMRQAHEIALLTNLIVALVLVDLYVTIWVRSW